MNKIKQGATVKIINGDGETYTVIKRIKGALTGRVVMHSGILADGMERKASKFLLTNGKEYYPYQLTTKL